MDDRSADSADSRGLHVPEVVPAQLNLNLSVIDDAVATREAMSPGHLARFGSTSAAQDNDLMVMALALMQPETRERIRFCVGWLLEMTTEVSLPRRGRSGHRSCPLRLLAPPA